MRSKDENHGLRNQNRKAFFLYYISDNVAELVRHYELSESIGGFGVIEVGYEQKLIN